MSDLRKAAEMALEALIGAKIHDPEAVQDEIQALRQALAQPDEVLAEREACAKVCDEQGTGRKALEHYAALTYSGATHDCAAAIRARGEK